MNTPTEPIVAWEVTVNDMRCIVFATTKPKAQWIAVKSLWEAYERRDRSWPRAVASRIPRHDRCVLRHDKEQKAWNPYYVEDSLID